MTSVFHGDKPINHPDEDRFGLGDIAGRLASALLEQSASKGFVLGVEGAWGSGKSSLLALMLDRLGREGADAVEIVEFRPWLVGDRDQLLSALFEDLSKAIAAAEHAAGDVTRGTAIAIKDIAGRVRRYARHLGSAGKLAGLAGLAVPGMGIVGAAMEKVAEAAAGEAEGPTLAAQKDELAGALEGLGRRIVVAVDDVDRLEPREVAELLRLVRSVADFPNVTYVLCYDGDTLATSIQTATGVRDGRAYLEKIVQTEVSVPRPESFALRRLFSTELAGFATCGGEVGQRLLQVIDMAGGRGFDTPRTVMRVLDSLRLFWRGLEGQVDLADLVWLRIIAVTSPRTYRWVEEYLDALAVVATGRGMVTNAEKTSVARRLDEALAADGTEWERVLTELHLVLPRMGYGGPAGEGKEDSRVFAQDTRPDPTAVTRRRLASPDHSRLYFALSRAPGSVDVADIDRLLAAARASQVEAETVLVAMAEERNASGASKAERMLDQLRNLEPERLSGTDLANLSMAVATVAEVVASTHEEEWGQPRAWRLAKKVLAAVRAAAGVRWEAILTQLFATSPRIDFLTHILREETFDHGIYGNRPDRDDTITTVEEFGAIRDAMFLRYRRLGIARIMELDRSASTLYAWSQAGGREELVAIVRDHVGDDDAMLLRAMLALAGRSREDGRPGSLDPSGLECLFDDVPSLLERVLALAASGHADAAAVLRSVGSSLTFRGGSIKGWIEHRRGTNGIAGPRTAGSSSKRDDGSERGGGE